MSREPGQLAVLIAACRPSADLADLVRTLSEKAGIAIVIVDDGSGPDYQDVFARAAAFPNVQLLRHALPLGKSAVLKTAINYVLCTIPDVVGLVAVDATADAAEDILRVAGALREQPRSLILGCQLTDNQTGPLGIPASLLAPLLRREAAGNEFEHEIFAAAQRLSIPVRELPSQTIDVVPKPSGFNLDHLRLGSGTAVRPDISRALTLSALFAVVFAVLLGVEIYGFQTNHLFTPDIWYPIGLKRFTRYGAEYLALAVPLLLVVPWTFAAFISALLIVLTAVSVGPLPLLAAAFFLVSSCALGSRLLGRTKTDSATTHLCATLLGTGVYVFLMTFMARMPVNYPWVWGILLAIPVAADLRGVWRRLTYWASRICSVELRSPWERISFAFLVFILVAHWFVALLPEIGGDGLAMHLAIPMNIAANHHMTFQPSRYLWSVMPMGADWLYTVVYLLGGEYAPRILNYAMLLAIVALLYRATRRWVTPAAGFLLAASLAATPVVQFVAGSLFVENFLVALVLGLMTALWHFGETGDKRFLYLAAAAGGTAMATKYGALVFIALALPFAIREIARHWKSLGPRPAAVCGLALLLLLATALPTYAIAYEKTGNPIFPFLNPKIHSPLLNPSVLIADARFRLPVSWSTLYTLTFHTTQAYEGQNGSFGFQYLIVAPLALLAILVTRRSPARSAAVLALGAGVLIMQSTANVRYLYTSMPLLLVAFAGLLGWMMSNQRWMYRVLLVYIFVTTALNTYFLPSSNYYHKDFCLRLPFSRTERERYLEEAAPVRKVIDYYNRNHPNSAVLLTSSTSIAGLTGDVFLNNWHQYSIVEQLRAATTPLDMFRLIERWKVGYFIAEALPPGDETVPPALDALLKACTVPEYVSGGFTLARLEPDCGPPSAVVPAASHDEVDPANQVVVQAGVYDDFDPSIIFHGNWAHDKSFEGAYGHTISYNDVAGAGISFAFRGTALTYVFTKAPNRGVATVTIDEKDPSTVDLYSPEIRWQARQRFCCFGPGRHFVVIGVTGRSHPKSTGRFIDLDSFVVE